jgi:hypothetical protein
LYSADVFGAWALRSLVAMCFALVRRLQKNAGRGQITRGDQSRRARQSCGSVAFGHRPHVRERAGNQLQRYSKTGIWFLAL